MSNANKVRNDDAGTLAGYTLEQLRELYRTDLFDDYLPFIDAHVYDGEYGGFMCNTDRRGVNVTTHKSAWYDGRGIWVYAWCVNHLGADKKYVEYIRKTADLILSIPRNGDFWPDAYTRDGRAITEKINEYSVGSDIYCDLFVANGLAEYGRMPGCERYRDMAKDILMRCVGIYDDPEYDYRVVYGQSQLHPLDQRNMPGIRVLGHWMVMLRQATQMLEFRDDPELSALADRCLDAIMDHHYNPGLGLMNEALSHDLTRTGDDFGQFCYMGHSIETMWMVMHEAIRRRDRGLYDLAAERFKRHVEIAWDRVYGGLFRSLDHVGLNLWKVDKALWVQEEALIGMLMMIEHIGDAWAWEWFDRLYGYVRERFPMKRHGYPLWILFADRHVTFVEEYQRIGNFHHPRHLMLNLAALDRIIERNGAVSGVFG